MIEFLYHATGILANLTIIGLSGWIVLKYLKIKKKMTEIDQIIDDVLLEPSENFPMSERKIDDQTEILRERLIGVAIAGQSSEFLGKNISSTEIEKLDEKEVKKLYSRYEARVGGMVTKSLKTQIISAYTNILGLLLPKQNIIIVEREKLEKSLNDGPFINLALNKYTCNLYHKFGHLLAPIEAALVTCNHLQKSALKPCVEAGVEPGVNEID